MSASQAPRDPTWTVAKALTHPIRCAILRQLTTTAGPVSASSYALQQDLSLARVNYHLRILMTLGVVEVIETVRHRGATESLCRPGGRNCERALAMLAAAERLGLRNEKSPPPPEG